MSLVERFRANVTQVEDRQPCWPWLGKTDRDGYGYIRLDKEPDERRGTKMQAHRVSWILHHHDPVIPSGMSVLHTCDNPPCVNPNHLYLGTAVENGRDARERKRHPQSLFTHCKRGHEFTEANTIVKKNGTRKCRTCHNLRRNKGVGRGYRTDIHGQQ